MTRIVIATRSDHKLGEIRAMVGDIPGLEIVDLRAMGIEESDAEDEIEVFDTFADNALAKARYFVALTGTPVLADDSGLCVDALGGRPGVQSKRYSGRDDLFGPALDRANNSLLLAEMSEVPAEERGAHYECAVAIAWPDGAEAVFHGTCMGTILTEPRGVGGFGYDPLFLSADLGRTFAEAAPEEKNRVSHRARAIANARDALFAIGQDGAAPIAGHVKN